MGWYSKHYLNNLLWQRLKSFQIQFAPILQIIFNGWSVKAEHTADQAGLIACKDVNSAVISLLKLAGGTNIEKEVDISKIINSPDKQEEILSSFVEYLSAHPFIENRIRQLINFASTGKF